MLNNRIYLFGAVIEISLNYLVEAMMLKSVSIFSSLLTNFERISDRQHSCIYKNLNVNFLTILILEYLEKILSKFEEIERLKKKAVENRAKNKAVPKKFFSLINEAF